MQYDRIIFILSFFYAKTLNLDSPKTRIFLCIEELFDMYMYYVLEQVLFIKIFHFSFYFSWHYHKMMTYCFLNIFPFDLIFDHLTCTGIKVV